MGHPPLKQGKKKPLSLPVLAHRVWETKGAHYLLYDTLKTDITQVSDDMQPELLSDKTKSGKERPWTQKKQLNMAAALGCAHNSVTMNDPSLLPDMWEKKAGNCVGCGKTLVFDQLKDGGQRLSQAFFCRERICAQCNYRRSVKLGVSVKGIFEEIKAREPDSVCLFGSFTLKNPLREDAEKVYQQMQKAFTRMINRKPLKSVLMGYLRAFEVTLDKRSPGTCHPHFHAIFVVKKEYFYARTSKGKHKYFMHMQQWRELWQKCLQVDYLPQVEVRRTSQEQGMIKAVLEVTKYTVKDTDVVDPCFQTKKTAENLRFLVPFLRGKRLVSSGGIVREIDVLLGSRVEKTVSDNADLLKLGDEEQLDDVVGRTVAVFAVGGKLPKRGAYIISKREVWGETGEIVPVQKVKTRKVYSRARPGEGRIPQATYEGWKKRQENKKRAQEYRERMERAAANAWWHE